MCLGRHTPLLPRLIADAVRQHRSLVIFTAPAPSSCATAGGSVRISVHANPYKRLQGPCGLRENLYTRRLGPCFSGPVTTRVAPPGAAE